MNDPSSLSRRQCIGSGLVTCTYLAATGLALARSQQTQAKDVYTQPGPITELGRAPGLQARRISENPNAEKTYAVIFAKGDEIMSGLTEFADREKIAGGHFTAIGALASAQFGWFDRARKAYCDIPINHQVELISLIGDVGLVDDAPQIHVHAAVGFPDGQVRGGHMLEAIVWPTVELFLTVYPTPLVKKHDSETNLFLFDPKEGKLRFK
jgi:uncharacterized protein